MTLEEKIAKLLTKRHQTLSIAESCSGGLLCHQLTNIPGSSKFFLAGFITYSNQAKIKYLGISKRLLDKFGAVSLPVAEGMALGVRKSTSSDFGIGITGIAGPSGGTAQKPVGLVCIAASKKNKTVSHTFFFKGSRLRIKSQTAKKALQILLKFITG